MRTIYLRSWILLTVLGLACGRATPQAIQYATGRGATTPDGLHLVQWEPFRSTYVRPGADLGAYNKVWIKEVTVSYKTPPPKDQMNPNPIDPNYALPSSAIAAIKSYFEKSFSDALDRSEFFTLAPGPGPGVLEVSGHLVNLQIRIPPQGDQSPDETIYVSSLGQVTLVLDARDSKSGEPLVRVGQDRAITSDDEAWFQADPVANSGAVRQMFDTWAEDLRQELDQFHALDVLPVLPTPSPTR